MEAVRIRTQCSELGVGGCFKTHTTKHFLPTPRAQGSESKEEKKKSQKRKIFLPAVGWAWDGCVLAISSHSRSPSSPHHPTRRLVGIFFFSTSSSPLGGFQRRSEGDSTCEERKGEWEIKQETKRIQVLFKTTQQLP